MILKLETYVEVNSSEPQVVKQVLTEKLNSALTELIKNQTFDGGLLMRVNRQDVANNSHLKKELISTESFIATLSGQLKGKLLTPDQVIERMRTGVK